MEDLASKLKYAAIDILHRVQSSQAEIEKDLRQAQLRVARFERELDSVKIAVGRFNSFTPEIEGKLQCPQCWLASERHNSLLPTASDTDADTFECRECRYVFSSE